MAKTTIQIEDTTNELLKTLKYRYRYRSIDELLIDTSRYFDEYNVSPREASKPITEHLKGLDKTFRSFFKEYESKLFIPFTEMQAKVNIKMLDFIEEKDVNYSSNISQKNEQINNENDNVYLSKNKYNDLISFVEKLKEIKHKNSGGISHNDGIYIPIEQKLFFSIFDSIDELDL